MQFYKLFHCPIGPMHSSGFQMEFQTALDALPRF